MDLQYLLLFVHDNQEDQVDDNFVFILMMMKQLNLDGLNLLLTDSFPRRLSAWSITSSCNKLEGMGIMIIIILPLLS